MDECESRAAFVDLLATMGEVADSYAGEAWGIAGPEDTAGALRALAHLLEGGLLGHFEDNPKAPVFRQIVSSTRKSLGDNADAIYFDTAVSNAYVYRVTGNTAGAIYTSFTMEEGGGDGAFPESTGGIINDTQFDIDADGNFAIALGGSPQDRNWLPLTDHTTRITSRHYWEELWRPGAEPVRDVKLGVEALGATEPPPPPSDAVIAAGFRRVANYVRSRTLGMGAPGTRDLPDFVSQIPNEFPPPVTPRNHPLAAIDAAYSTAPYLLGPEEALVMRMKWPECRCANVMIWNRYLQTLDYVHRTVSLNRAQMVLDDDGWFTAVIAHRDPGVPNWIDTEGNAFAMVFWRFMLPEGPIETPHATVVPVDSLG